MSTLAKTILIVQRENLSSSCYEYQFYNILTILIFADAKDRLKPLPLWFTISLS